MSLIPCKPLPEYIKNYLNQINYAGMTFKKMAVMAGLTEIQLYKNLRCNVSPKNENRDKILNLYKKLKANDTLRKLKFPKFVTRDGISLKGILYNNRCTLLEKRKYRKQVVNFLRKNKITVKSKNIAQGVMCGGFVKIRTSTGRIVIYRKVSWKKERLYLLGKLKPELLCKSNVEDYTDRVAI